MVESLPSLRIYYVKIEFKYSQKLKYIGFLKIWFAILSLDPIFLLVFCIVAEDFGGDAGWVYIFEETKCDPESRKSHGDGREKQDSNTVARHAECPEHLQCFSEVTLTECRGDECKFCSSSSTESL